MYQGPGYNLAVLVSATSAALHLHGQQWQRHWWQRRSKGISDIMLSA